jgi:hypothetical protein
MMLIITTLMHPLSQWLGAMLPHSSKGPPSVSRRPGLDKKYSNSFAGYNFLGEIGKKEGERGDSGYFPVKATR